VIIKEAKKKLKGSKKDTKRLKNIRKIEVEIKTLLLIRLIKFKD